jgi:hypothetical protein
MVQASASGRWRGAAGALPRIQADVMVVPAGADERGLQAHSCGELETQDSTVEVEGSFKVRDLEMDVPD